MQSNTFRFVMEEPAEAGKGQQKKRARLVTACDNCRNKKIKCLRTPPQSTSVCESCRQANIECTFTDRDKYQAEKLGVPYQPYPISSASGANGNASASGEDEGGVGPVRRNGHHHNNFGHGGTNGNGNGHVGKPSDTASASGSGSGSLPSPMPSPITPLGLGLADAYGVVGATAVVAAAARTSSTPPTQIRQPTPIAHSHAHAHPHPHSTQPQHQHQQPPPPVPTQTGRETFASLLSSPATRMFPPLSGPSVPPGGPAPGDYKAYYAQLHARFGGGMGVNGAEKGKERERERQREAEAEGHEGEKGELTRISVPFFRYFGATANTPGYRRINVHTHTYNAKPPRPSGSGGSRDPSPDVPRVSQQNSDGPSPPMPVPPAAAMQHGYAAPNGTNANPNAFDPFSTAVRHPFHRPPLTNPLSFGNGSNAVGSSSSGRAATIARPASPKLPEDNRPLFDPADDVPTMPHPDHLPHLADLFFDYLGCHFPFLDREEVSRDIREKKISATLAVCIAALGIRFTDRSVLLFPNEEDNLAPRRARSAEKYCMRAKEIVTPYLSLPSIEIVQALVLIAWAEFGSGRDSGLWMYSRMAVAMAMDLGLGFEATIQLVTDQPEKIRATWWAVILVDRINCWGTGRPIAIPDDAFDTEPPYVPAVPGGYTITNPPPPTYVFGHLCRLVQLRGRMGDLINNTVKRKLSTSPVDMELTSLQYEMMAFYASLPGDLQFNLANFKLYFHCNQGALFLILHVMFHSVLIVLHRPQLLEDFTPDVPRASMPSVELSRSSARTIVDMVLLTDEQGPRALMANPFVDLPILTAARSFLEDRKEFPSGTMPISIIMSRKWPDSSIAKCKQFLAKMSKYWGGVMAVRRILEEQDMSPDGNFDLGRGEGGDSQVAPPRPDTELIKQWATKAWRMHVGENRKKQRAHAGDANTPTSPTDSDPANLNRLGDSPEGASIGITGTLDSLLGYTTEPGFESMLASQDPANLLRVSFNPAEADFQFSNLPAQYYSIADPVDNFLQTLQGVPQMPQEQEQPPIMDVTMTDGTASGTFDTDAMLLFQNEIGRFFRIPEHLSRAPSPTLPTLKTESS